MIEKRLDALEKSAYEKAGNSTAWADIRALLIALAALASPWIMHWVTGGH